jgi:diguanylate cyclase (GGDEF)-like protein/PAS domain S-box-containing protein
MAEADGGTKLERGAAWRPTAHGEAAHGEAAHGEAAHSEAARGEEPRFVTDLASAMLVAPTALAGVEQALAATCRFLGCGAGTAQVIDRRPPHEVRLSSSVTEDGRPAARSPLTLPVRKALTALPDADGLLLSPGGADGAAAARLARRAGRRGVRVFRVPVDENHVVVVSFSSCAPAPAAPWAAWQVRVAGAAARLVAHGLARALLEDRLQRQRDVLAATEARWRGLVEGLHAAIARVDLDGTVRFATEDVSRFGLRVDDIVGRHYGAMLPGAARAELEPVLAQAFAGHRVETRLRLETEHGERWCDLRVAPETDDEGRVASVLVLAFDATERTRSEASVALAASTDPLTGLANRTVFVQELDRSLSSARAVDHQLALLFIDLDKFKRINDTLGHLVGDELLRQVAARLRSLVRADDVVARFGGDEFAVLVKHTRDVGEVERLVEKLRAELARPMELNGSQLHVSASIGATLSAPDIADASELLRCADHAMYQAKQLGRNRTQVFDDAMRIALRSRVDMEEALRRALDEQAIDVHYLPEVDIRTGMVVAVEALIRWRHHERGLLTASAFLGLAEDSGLIAELGAHVLQTACRNAAAWGAINPALVVRVNLSARQLGIPRLLGDIAQALVCTGLDAGRLSVEVSEATLVADPEPTLDVLRKIHNLGVLVSLDDVGTGHSAFTHLERLPVDALKIDRRFVAALHGGATRERRIVQNLAQLGEALGVVVIAEGVEHEEQVDVLRAIGVNRAQGHLFAGDCPAEGIEQLLTRAFATR